MNIIIDRDIQLCSINQKYVNRHFATSKKYKDFKLELNAAVYGFKFNPPFAISIWVKTRKDIDAAVKCILDGIEPCLGNDAHVMELHVYKEKRKLKDPEHLKIIVEEL